MSQRPVVVTLYIDGRIHVIGSTCDASLSVMEVVSHTPFFIHVMYLLHSVNTIQHVTQASIKLNNTRVVVATVLHVYAIEITIYTNDYYHTVLFACI